MCSSRASIGRAVREGGQGLCGWRERKYNVAAGHLANMALDAERDAYRESAPAQKLGPDALFQLQTDGGWRAGKCAVGWILYRVVRTNQGKNATLVEVACGAQFLGRAASSFQTEAIALETGLSQCIRMLFSSFSSLNCQ